jgi:glycosyltransferase involved in cell wall biosynthesis
MQVMTVPQSFSFLSGQLRFLAEQGFAVHAVSSPGSGWDLFIKGEPVVPHVVSMPRRITPFQDLIAVWRLYRLMRTIRPQIVHAHTPKGGLLGMLAAWLANVPVRVYTIHGLPLMTARGWRRLLLLWTERVACWCALRVLSVSPSIRSVAIQKDICPASKVEVFHGGSSNGIDAQQHFNRKHLPARTRVHIRAASNIPEDALVLGFVGRIVRDKGIVELIEAWQTLREQFPSLHMLLVGPFELKDPLPSEAMHLLRSDPRIHLVGSVTEVPPYYAAMDLLVLPTYREGLPGVLLECAAMKLPVVATRIPGCVDAVVDGETGTLVEPRDAKSLGEAIALYLNSPELRCQHGAAGRRWVLDQFCPERIWLAIYEEYVRLLRQCNLPPPTDDAEAAVPTQFQERSAA